MTASDGSVKFLNGILVVLLALIWGSSFMLMKKGLVAFPALQLAGIRVFISFLVLSPFLIPALRALKKEHVKILLLVSMFGSGFPAIFYAISLTKLDSSVAGIINSMVPLFTLWLGILFFGLAFRWKKLIGVISGLIGVAFLVLIDARGNINVNYTYALLPVLATIFYGTNSNLIKRFFNDMHPLHLASLIYLCVGIPGGIYILFTDFSNTLLNHEQGISSFFYITTLAIVGSAMGMVLFTKLIQRTSALFASTVTYLVPIVAIIWGLLDGEVLGWVQLIGMAFILAGVYIVNSNYYRSKINR